MSNKKKFHDAALSILAAEGEMAAPDLLATINRCTRGKFKPGHLTQRMQQLINKRKVRQRQDGKMIYFAPMPGSEPAPG